MRMPVKSPGIDILSHKIIKNKTLPAYFQPVTSPPQQNAYWLTDKTYLSKPKLWRHTIGSIGSPLANALSYRGNRVQTGLSSHQAHIGRYLIVIVRVSGRRGGVWDHGPVFQASVAKSDVLPASWVGNFETVRSHCDRIRELNYYISETNL